MRFQFLPEANVEQIEAFIMVPGNWTTALKKFVNVVEC